MRPIVLQCCSLPTNVGVLRSCSAEVLQPTIKVKVEEKPVLQCGGAEALQLIKRTVVLEFSRNSEKPQGILFEVN